MSGLDSGVTLVVLIGALLGLSAGALRQLLPLAAWAAAIAAPYQLAGAVARQLQGQLSLPYSLVYAFSILALALLAWVTVRVAIATLVADPESREPGLVDRVAGGFVGAFKGVLVAWVLLSLLSLSDDTLRTRGWQMSWAEGRTYRWTRKHDLFSWLLRDRFEKVREGLARAQEDLSGQAKAVSSWASDERVRRLMQDVETRAAIEKGDLEAALRNSEVVSLLTDNAAVSELKAALADF